MKIYQCSCCGRQFVLLDASKIECVHCFCIENLTDQGVFSLEDINLLLEERNTLRGRSNDEAT